MKDSYLLGEYELKDSELLDVLMKKSSAIAVNVGDTRLLLMQDETLVIMLQEAWAYGRETNDPNPFVEE